MNTRIALNGRWTNKNRDERDKRNSEYGTLENWSMQKDRDRIITISHYRQDEGK